VHFAGQYRWGLAQSPTARLPGEGRYSRDVISLTPDPIAIQVGPIAISWYSIGYAAALLVAAWLVPREAERRGLDRRQFAQGVFLVVLFGIVGARLYHVIDQWDVYSRDLLRIVLPPYSGLGLFGGVFGGLLGLFLIVRRQGQPFLRWADACVPALFIGQAIARWGNFANQELYGRPTDLPWGIAIDCEHRVVTAAIDYSCARLPFSTTGFHPLFFYESALTLAGAVVALWLSRRHLARLRDGDLVGLWLVWYGAVRAVLEPFREGYDWTFFGVPVAILVSAVAIGAGLLLVVTRSRRSPSEALPGDAGNDAGDGHSRARDPGDPSPGRGRDEAARENVRELESPGS
jgi:phosphatidylglycerol---prolipoprotein diacylglyceryl transferase